MDMMFKEGNLPTGERTVVRTGLPGVFWRILNQGTPSSKSKTVQIDDGCGMLEAFSEVDKDLAELNGLVSEFRLSEAQAFIEAMNQEMASTLFYGNNSVAPEEFNGLAIRYSDASAQVGRNMLDAEGDAAAGCTSIWLVTWGANSLVGIFPKGSKAGLQHEDLGLQTIEVMNGIGGNRMRAYQDHWQWKCGIALKDWRYVARICNIEVADLIADNLSGATPDLIKLMIKATYRMPSLRAGKTAFYCNRTVLQYLDIQRFNAVKAGGGLTYEVVDGKNIPMFRGIPVRLVDAILDTENPITFP